MHRDEAVKRIRAGLKKNSKIRFSVRPGTGTTWGWINIKPMPKDLGEFGRIKPEHIQELQRIFGANNVSNEGVDVAASTDHRQEFVARSEGRTPEVIGKPYWD